MLVVVVVVVVLVVVVVVVVVVVLVLAVVCHYIPTTCSNSQFRVWPSPLQSTATSSRTMTSNSEDIEALRYDRLRDVAEVMVAQVNNAIRDMHTWDYVLDPERPHGSFVRHLHSTLRSYHSLLHESQELLHENEADKTKLMHEYRNKASALLAKINCLPSEAQAHVKQVLQSMHEAKWHEFLFSEVEVMSSEIQKWARERKEHHSTRVTEFKQEALAIYRARAYLQQRSRPY